MFIQTTLLLALSTLANSQHRIALYDEFPFAAHVYGPKNCAGSLVSASVVITACNCLSSYSESRPVIYDVNRMLVAAGILNLNTKMDKRNVKRVISMGVHERCGNLTEGGWKYDIGHLVVQSPFILGDDIQIAPIYSYNQLKFSNFMNILEKEETVCKLIGWGSHEDQAGILQVTYVDLTSLLTCRQMLCDQNLPCNVNFQDSGLLCATGRSLSNDTCPDGYGGPLVCETFVVGVLAWGRSCGSSKLPNFYARLDSYVERVLSATKATSIP